jgi:microcystin-dependent protein
MSEQFLGEIRMFSFNFAPKGWAACNGQTMSIQQNTALFALIGTFYGGDGIRTFQLPNLQGRAPLHMNSNGTFVIGQLGGQESHTLLTTEIPQHNHLVGASNQAATSLSPSSNTLAVSPADPYVPSSPNGLVALNPGTVPAAGGSQPHENRQPFLVITFCIALIGIFPTRS